MNIQRILLISTGGTIGGRVVADEEDNGLIKEANHLYDIIKPTISYFKRIWDLDIEIEEAKLCDIDSSDILPTHWIDLINLISIQYDKYDSFIITHGTNTLGYTCAAISFAFGNLGKPVILTCSQVPVGMPGTDALTNLNNALRVAVWPHDHIQGVVSVFGSHIIAGTRVKKKTLFDYDAFNSFLSGSIGRIGRIINFDNGNLPKTQ